MAQELIYKVAIIGGGPAGCFCAFHLQNDVEVTVFEHKKVLGTLLPTGGGRCNLANFELDFKELSKNYPRGEKFLYSVFSKFCTEDTIKFFKKIGVNTYTQNDMRIFPKSNSAEEVREKFLNNLNKVKFKKEQVMHINKNPLAIETATKTYLFDAIIIASGGHSSYEFIKELGHNIIETRPALTALKTKENFSSISGVSIKSVNTFAGTDDLLFTHYGISGPIVYKISSINARKTFPYKIIFNLVEDFNLQDKLNKNPHKNIENLLAEFVPKSFAKYILKTINIENNTKCHTINGKTRDLIIQKLHKFEITITGTAKDGEIVTCGGVDLKEIDSKTMQSKIVKNIYFCGEVMDIDGFCGGFNLQNCWSTGYVATNSILNNIKKAYA